MKLTLFNTSNTELMFEMLERCEGVTSVNEHHPEKDTLSHSLQTFNHAMRESNDVDVILSALLHDVGKCISALSHEEVAVGILSDHISAKTSFLIEQHMRIKLLLNGKMKKRSKVLFLIGHPWLPELILLARWDIMGRSKNINPVFNKEETIDRLNSKAILPRKDISQ